MSLISFTPADNNLMKITNILQTCLKTFSCIAILLLPGTGAAETRTEELKRCLQDFDGIKWQLPYQPPILIRACATPTTTYDTSEKTLPGNRSLELIGELTLGSDSTLSSDETYAALQEAILAHFDALFRRYGYHRTAQEYDDARTQHYPNTMRILRGQSPLRESAAEEPVLPPIPYIRLARYQRSVSGKEFTLTIKTESRNTWRITLEGLPVMPDTSGAKR